MSCRAQPQPPGLPSDLRCGASELAADRPVTSPRVEEFAQTTRMDGEERSGATDGGTAALGSGEPHASAVADEVALELRDRPEDVEEKASARGARGSTPDHPKVD